MKSTMKTIATLTLTACVLTGGAISSFAAAPASAVSAAVIGHQSSTCGDSDNTNGEIIARFTNTDGSTSTYTICAEGGEVNGEDTLTELSSYSIFSGTHVYTGTLDNGERVMTVAALSGGKATTTNENVNVWVSKSAIDGYDLYLVNSDGTETKLDVSYSGSDAILHVSMKDGASLIHMVSKAGR